MTLAGGEQSHELVIETDQARGPLTVEVPVLPHEAIAANNVVPFQIAPRPATIRVLYMEGTGPPEERFLKDALEEDPGIRCTTMSSTIMYDQKPILHRGDNPRLGYPTSRQELFEYDVVICSDIARTAFTREQLDWTVELVAQRGGGFVMIGGNTSFGGGGWDQTIWDGMIPIDMSGRGTRRSETYWGPLRVLIPPQAESHPIWRIVDDPVRNRAILDRLPQFYGTNLTNRLKPAATALGRSDREIPGSGIVTVFSCQSFGRGRSFAMSTDTTRDWGADFERIWGEGDNRYYRKFWRNVVRWLAENSAGSNRRLRAEIDKIIYRPGQPIVIAVQAFDEEARPADSYRVIARLRRPDPAGKPRPADSGDSSQGEARTDLIASVELTPHLADHTYRGELPAPSAGTILENPGSTLQTTPSRGRRAGRRAERRPDQHRPAIARRSGRIPRSATRPGEARAACQVHRRPGLEVARGAGGSAHSPGARGRPAADLAKTGLGPVPGSGACCSACSRASGSSGGVADWPDGACTMRRAPIRSSRE